jgi:hypothetical protein
MPNSLADQDRANFSLGFNDATFAILGTAILLFGAALWTSRSANVEKTDFSLTYVGAKLVHDGLGRELYDLTLQQRMRNSLFQHPVPLFFEHPPWEAVLLSPLASLGFHSAYLIWASTNVAIWLILMFWLRTYLPWPRDSLAYICLWLLFAPLWVALYQGQSSFWVLLAYALCFVLLRKDRDFSGGLALGLGLVKFQFVVPFALIFLFRGKWRFLTGFLASAFILVIVSAVGVGWKGITDYEHFLVAIGSNPQNVSYGSGVDMPTIHGFVYALIGKLLSGTQLNLIVAVISLALLAWVAFTWGRSDKTTSFDLMFGATVTSSLLSGSHMFTHDFSPLIPAMLLVAAQKSSSLRASANGRIPWALLQSALVLFWAFPIYFLFVKWHCLYLMGIVLFVFVTATVRISTFSRSQIQGVATG